MKLFTFANMNKNKIILLFLVLSISFMYNIQLNYIRNPLYIEELRLIWGPRCYHIHHLITFSGIILLLLIGKYSPSIITYIIIMLCLGSIAEDFLFSDIFIIREPC